jgi:hypothetical protein
MAFHSASPDGRFRTPADIDSFFNSPEDKTKSVNQFYRLVRQTPCAAAQGSQHHQSETRLPDPHYLSPRHNLWKYEMNGIAPQGSLKERHSMCDL